MELSEQPFILFLLFLVSLALFPVAKRLGLFTIPSTSSIEGKWYSQLLKVFIAFLLYYSGHACMPVLSAYLLKCVAFLPLKMEDVSIKSAEITVWAYLIALIVSGVCLVGFSQLPYQRLSIWGNRGFWRPFSRGILYSCILYPMVIFCVSCVHWIVEQFGLVANQKQIAIAFFMKWYSVPSIFVTLLVVITMLIPLIEELLFRGFLQNFFGSCFRNSVSIGCASVLFAGMHYAETQGARNIELLVGLFFFSYCIGIVYLKEKALSAAVGMHVAFNTLGLLMVIITENFEKQ